MHSSRGPLVVTLCIDAVGWFIVIGYTEIIM
jgi:hypothetical protein